MLVVSSMTAVAAFGVGGQGARRGNAESISCPTEARLTGRRE